MTSSMQFTDNYTSTRQTIAQHIRRSALGAFVHGNELNDIADGTNTLTSNFGYIDVTFRNAGTDCSLRVQANFDDNLRTERLERLDDDGNEWSEYELSCTVNHPTHGSVSPGTGLARFQFWLQAAMLAAEIEVEFGDTKVARITETALQRRERAEKLAQMKRDEALRTLVDSNASSLRKGKVLSVSVAATMGELTVGTHSVTTPNKRCYTVVIEGTTATITRIS